MCIHYNDKGYEMQFFLQPAEGKTGIILTAQTWTDMINTDKGGDTLEPIISYRLEATGVWGYGFYDHARLIGSVSGINSPSAPVRIRGGNRIEWYSTFQIDTVIVAGVSRKIKDNHTGGEVYRIVFCEPGFFRLMSNSVNLLAEKRKDIYLYGKDGAPATAMTERISEAEWMPPRGRMKAEPWFRTTFYEESLTEEVMMAILSFPALWFY